MRDSDFYDHPGTPAAPGGSDLRTLILTDWEMGQLRRWATGQSLSYEADYDRGFMRESDRDVMERWQRLLNKIEQAS